MKTVCRAVLIVCATATFTLISWTRTDDVKDYGLGRTIGQCLVARCTVFRGFVVSEAPKTGQPVVIQITEQLFGKTIETRTIELAYADPLDARKSGASPNRAWRGSVNFSKNVPVIVAVALEPIDDILPGDPVLVSSNEHSAAVIRSLVETAARLRASPTSVSDEVASLARRANPSLAGYLFTHLRQREGINNPGLETMLLAQMVGSPSVPPQFWDELAQYARSDYFRLNVLERAALIQRFSELGQHSDKRAAGAAFHALDKLSSIDDAVRRFVDPSTRAKLEKAYKDLVSNGDIIRSPALESGLGLTSAVQ